MKLALFAAALVLPATVLADTASVAYDQTYDNGSTSLDVVACSNGLNGLESKGFTNFSSLPSFPFIGAAGAVTGWNSTSCGTCWQLTFQNTSINVLAVDSAGPGEFNIALTAMNNLTNGQAVQLGRVTAQAVQVNASVCGLK